MRLIQLLPLLALLACGDKDPAEVDADGDGVFADLDCNDDDDTVAGPDLWYADADADGHGGDSFTVEACEAPEGAFAEATDCDDLNAAVNPDAAEVCNGWDDNCDGAIDDADSAVDSSTFTSWYADNDGDGYGGDTSTTDACEAPEGYSASADDCDDSDPALNPDTLWYQDLDRDTYGAPEYTVSACVQPDGYVADSSDCDDLRDDVNPDGLEICNDGVDDDCDGAADDADPDVDLATASDWYTDADADGYGDPASTPVLACAGPSGTTPDSTDCDDAEPLANPGETEICADGIDNDCDGTPNECGLPGYLDTPDADALVVGPSAMNLGFESTVGDFNGDGAADLSVASYYYQGADGSSYGGLTHVFYGPITADVAALADQDAGFQGDNGSDYSGKTLGAGDFNGDGYDDLLVSSYQDDNIVRNGGSVFLFYGAASGWTGTESLSGGAQASWAGQGDSDFLGLTVRGLGDLNGDGFDELGMGADGADITESNAGAVYIVAGQASQHAGLDQDPSQATLVIAGTSSNDYFGDYRSLVGLGDIDGDGYDDFVMSATSSDPNGTSSGGVHLGYGTTLSSSLTITVDSLDAAFVGEGTSDYMGSGVAPAGDVDGDGYVDFMASADGNDDSASNAGKVYLFAGGATRYAGTHGAADATATFTGEKSSDYLGEGLASGDVNGDGFSDLMMGADGYDGTVNGNTVNGAGAVYMFYGSVSGTHSVVDADFVMAGVDSSGQLGQNIQSADLDNDGYDDIIGSAYSADYLAIMFGAPGI